MSAAEEHWESTALESEVLIDSCLGSKHLNHLISVIIIVVHRCTGYLQMSGVCRWALFVLGSVLVCKTIVTGKTLALTWNFPKDSRVSHLYLSNEKWVMLVFHM